MVRAINQKGMVSEFSDRVWAMLPKHKNGFIELSEMQTPVHIPEKIIEFQAKVKEQPPVVQEFVQTATPQDDKARMDIMKAYLTSKGIKFHPNIGYDKLKTKYDDSKK
jgi:hypothetical protein